MNKKILEVVVGICLLASCSDGEKNSLPVIEATQVNIHPNIGKTVTVEVTFSRPNDFYIDYWASGSTDVHSIFVPENTESTQRVILHQLKENTSYHYTISFGDETMAVDPIGEFRTSKRSDAVDKFYDESANKVETGLDGHFLFHKTGHPSVILIVDSNGKVVWYRTSPNMIKVANLTHRNTLLTIESSSDQSFSDGDRILETNLAGDTLLLLKFGVQDFNKTPHHDLLLTKENYIAFLTQESKGEFNGDGILVLDRNGQRVWKWSSFSDITNPDLETYVQPWGNSLVEDETSYYVSFRALSQVWKINKQNQNVEWKLGKEGDFPVDPAAEFLFQHFAHFNHSGDLLLFDNGETENRPFSRILSLRLADSQTISPKINIQLPTEYFSPFMGSVQQLNTEEFLVCSATNGTILGVNRSGAISWNLQAEDRMYRCVYIENVF